MDKHVMTAARVEPDDGGHVIVWQTERGVDIGVNNGSKRGRIVSLTPEQAGHLVWGLRRALLHLNHPDIAQRLDAGDVRGAASAFLEVLDA